MPATSRRHGLKARAINAKEPLTIYRRGMSPFRWSRPLAMNLNLDDRLRPTQEMLELECSNTAPSRRRRVEDFYSQADTDKVDHVIPPISSLRGDWPA